ISYRNLLSFPTRRSSDLISQSAPQNRLKQLLRLPLAAGVEKILRAPTAVLATVGPDDAGQATPSQADQRTESLPHAALKGALLRSEEHTSELQSLAYLVC